MTNLKIKAELRTDGNARRIRRNGATPCIINGGKGETISLQFEGSEPEANIMHEIVYEKDGKQITENVMVYNVHRYPIGNKVLHIDFLRVNDDTEVTIPVTVRYVGQDRSKAIKMEGATLGVAVSRVKVTCALKLVPSMLEANVSELKIGRTLYATDLPLPKGVKLANEKIVLALATMNKPRGGVKEA